MLNVQFIDIFMLKSALFYEADHYKFSVKFATGVKWKSSAQAIDKETERILFAQKVS